MKTSSRSTVLVAGMAGSALALSACTGGSTGGIQPPVGQVASALRLVSYDSCEDALAELKRAVAEYVSPYGLGGGYMDLDGDVAVMPQAAAGERGSLAAGGADDSAGVTAPQEYSTTNTHEIGVDEPDLVKTDGRRIVTLIDGTLHVVDTESRKVTGELVLSDANQGQWWAEQLLLSGDRALVLGHGAMPFADRAVDLFTGSDAAMPTYGPSGSRLVLVDLTGDPEVIGTLDLDGTYVDARQVDSTARLVVRSGPRLNWTYPEMPSTNAEVPLSEAEALAANREILERSTIEDWLPRFVASDADGASTDGLLVDCEDVSHPREYSGTSMLTVVTLDLAGEPQPQGSVSVVADGQTVYGTEESLYIADDHRAFAMPVDARSGIVAPAAPQTEVHKFDVSDPGQPRYVASGQADGWLLNQYSLSEHDDHLRIATTEDDWTAPLPQNVPASQSQVTVLAQRGDRLVEVGSVGGLGKGEQIYAVRFIGPVGYVVTFRQTDPLYTLDLSNPRRPQVVGELKVPGYSAYLHPAGDARLLGVGQNADEQGMTLGAQVSLFDVSDPAAPDRLDTFAMSGAWSDAEHDPHAFLYWPDDRLVVIPVWANEAWGGPVEDGGKLAMAGGALVLRVDGDALTEVGVLSHVRSANQVDWTHDPSIRRSLVIGDTLWTVSGSGALASDVDDLAEQAWVPFAG